MHMKQGVSINKYFLIDECHADERFAFSATFVGKEAHSFWQPFEESLGQTEL
jgi:hypothetical protein